MSVGRSSSSRAPLKTVHDGTLLLAEASILGGPRGAGPPPNIFLRGVKGEGKARGGEREGK